MIKLIDNRLLDETGERARRSPRLRINHNFHERLDDPVNRLLNAMEPGSYIRPHRHLSPPKEEIFLLLRGRVALFLFDDEGSVTERHILDPLAGAYGAELPAGTWHSLLVLAPGSVVYEVKRGPFVPLAPEDLAPWSPPAEAEEEARAYMRWLGESLEE